MGLGSSKSRRGGRSAVGDEDSIAGSLGLRNLGNTCFMNAALQCMSNTGPLVDFFFEETWTSQINRNNILGYRGQVAEAFGSLIRELWQPPAKVVTKKTDLKQSIAPRAFKSTVAENSETFRGNQQHDCQELLLFLLDALHEDLNRIMKKPYVEELDYDGKFISYESDVKSGKEPVAADEDTAAMNSWIGHLRRNQSVIVDLFQGQLRSVLQCKTCGHKNIKFDVFMNLELPLIHDAAGTYGETDINSLLREFSKTEELCGDHQWRCPKCKELRDATKKLSIFNLPNVLIITFKRFEAGQKSGKVGAKVNFPLTGFDLSPGISRNIEETSEFRDNSDDNDPFYDLYAVANHYGSMSGGHYTAFAQNKTDQQWYQFDDARVQRMGASDVCTKDAYVLFFRKQKLQSKLGSALEEEESANASREGSSVHSKQRPSVKKRLENWKGKYQGESKISGNFNENEELQSSD